MVNNEIPVYYEIYNNEKKLFTIVKEKEIVDLFCEYNKDYSYKPVFKKNDDKIYDVPEKLKIIQVDKKDLVFKEIKKIDINVKLPLLINQYNEVVLGNCLENLCENMVECIRIKTEPYMKDVLFGLELAVVEENSKERIWSLEKELSKFLSDYFNNDECISLFDNEILKETRTISEVTFIKPPAYNFIKHKKKIQEEEKDEFNLFSDLL